MCFGVLYYYCMFGECGSCYFTKNEIFYRWWTGHKHKSISKTHVICSGGTHKQHEVLLKLRHNFTKFCKSRLMSLIVLTLSYLVLGKPREVIFSPRLLFHINVGFVSSIDLKLIPKIPWPLLDTLKTIWWYICVILA